MPLAKPSSAMTQEREQALAFVEIVFEEMSAEQIAVVMERWELACEQNGWNLSVPAPSCPYDE